VGGFRAHSLTPVRRRLRVRRALKTNPRRGCPG
jgi:hypothetical protein